MALLHFSTMDLDIAYPAKSVDELPLDLDGPAFSWEGAAGASEGAAGAEGAEGDEFASSYYTAPTPHVARKQPPNAFGRGRFAKRLRAPPPAPEAPGAKPPRKGSKAAEELEQGGTTVHERYLYYDGLYKEDKTRVARLRREERSAECDLFEECAPLACMVLALAKNVNHEHHIFSTARSGGMFLGEMRRVYTDYLPKMRAKSGHVRAFEDYLETLFVGGQAMKQRSNSRALLVGCIRFIFELHKSPNAYKMLQPYVVRGKARARPSTPAPRETPLKRRKVEEEEESEDEYVSESDSDSDEDSSSSSDDDDDDESSESEQECEQSDKDNFAWCVREHMGAAVWDSFVAAGLTDPRRVEREARLKRVPEGIDPVVFEMAGAQAAFVLTYM
jgi:hypothetical protein